MAPYGSYNQVYAACPFYVIDNARDKTISCEPITDTEYPMKRRFKHKTDMEACMRDYCCKNYKYCEHYRMLMQYKYNEEEDI